MSAFANSTSSGVIGLHLSSLNEEVSERHTEGPEQRIVQLYDALRPPLYRYLINGGLSPQDAEEVVQEAFLRLYRHMRSGGGEENLRAWVYQVAHNLSCNFHKGRRRLVETTPEIWKQLSESAFDRAPGPEEQLLEKGTLSPHSRWARKAYPVAKGLPQPSPGGIPLSRDRRNPEHWHIHRFWLAQKRHNQTLKGECMKKRHSNPGSAAVGLFIGDHLTEEALLRSLDGELSAREADDVDGHIHSCWSCRSRRQAMGDGIAELFEYQNAVTAPYLPPPVDQRTVFIARLDALADEMGRPSRFREWLSGARRLLSPGEMSQVGWIVGMFALFALLPVAYFLHSPEVVSVNDLLLRAKASEMSSFQSASEPVVVQKLRISAGKKSLTRTMYRDVKRHRTAGRTNSGAGGEALVKAAYSKYSLDWDSSLDAEAYTRLRASLPVQSDRVARLGNDQLTLETTYASGGIAETDLTLRTADYHAVKEKVRLQDNSEIEIAELSYDVVPFGSVPTDVFGRPSLPAAILPSVVAAPRPIPPDRAVLAAAEVQVEVALHGLGADLGEQIKIGDHTGHELLIEGVVEDDARKQQLIAALQEIPHTRLRLVTIDEAAQRSSPSPAKTDSSPPLSIQQMVVTAPLLDAQLNAHFPDKDQRIAYVNQTLSMAQLASARAWALDRLAARHPLPEVAVLNEDARRQLQVLLADHVSALREDISSLQNQLGAILSRSSNTPAANTSVQAPLTPGAAGALDSSDDWRERIRRIRSSTEAIHEAVVALLSSSQPSEQKDGAAIEVNLRTSLTQLQTELQTLDQRVHETNLK
ncbi:RNA polymerase sigma-70 factor, ECF subfamily [Acidisarcina polymorpha]|uniref:RNA polymerase sigma-70 factor, ECF subfamily n=1 Tax=Acidisarcina polymorpha TaxID=2211140 RepID=A0A2Z5G0L5_9BACT|nr:sigma factor [Acidisarcina polymorpha]AXC12540.1 RNA polymerase sigma-70 factor, ECF subfamily [Acidisarcina polymorpha]